MRNDLQTPLFRRPCPWHVWRKGWIWLGRRALASTSTWASAGTLKHSSVVVVGEKFLGVCLFSATFLPSHLSIKVNRVMRVQIRQGVGHSVTREPNVIFVNESACRLFKPITFIEWTDETLNYTSRPPGILNSTAECQHGPI